MKIDINCDVGEGFANEEELFPFISSCNIACGGHAGDANSMRSIIQLAKKHHLKIGAHPSYPDVANFGRVSMNIDSKELEKSIKNQIESLLIVLKEEAVKMYHIKPHGALYNDVAKYANLAVVFLNAITPYKNDILLYVPNASVIEKLALKAGFKVKLEAFGDRNYNEDLSLVSRKESNALLTVPSEVIAHVVNMVNKGYVQTITNKEIQIQADTVCIHGDTTNALDIVSYLARELPKHNIHITH